MPNLFLRCVSAGGRIRTKELPDNKYLHICFFNGKSYAGEVKTKKTNFSKELLNKRAK